MNRFYKLVVVSLFLSFGFINAQIQITLPTISGTPGSDVIVDINVNNITPYHIQAYQLQFIYDSNLIELRDPGAGANNGTISQSAMLVYPAALTANPYKVQCISGTDLTGSGVLFRVKARILQSGTATLALDPTFDNYFANADLQKIVPTSGTNAPPIFIQVTPQTITENSTLTFTVVATDAELDPITYGVSSTLPTGATFNPSTRTFSWTPTYSPSQEGLYHVTFTANDGHSTTSMIVDITVIRLTNSPPQILPISPKTVNEGQLLTFDVVAGDDEGNPLTFLTPITLPAGATYTPLSSTSYRFSWTPNYAQSGPYSIIFPVSDGFSTTNRTVSITVNNVNTAPTITPIPDKSVAVGHPLTFDVIATDAQGDALIYSATGLPTGALFDPALHRFNWTPTSSPSQAGNYVVTFNVNDGTTTSSINVNITVTAGNTAPVITPVGNRNINSGQLLTFDIIATDGEGDPLTYTTSTLPTGASFDPTLHRFSWTPTYSQGSLTPYSVTFMVSDGNLTSIHTILITVTAVNSAPVITPIADKLAPAGQLLTFDIVATDADADPLTYSASGVPQGGTFDPALHRFSWTPTNAQAGNHPILFLVSDGKTTSTITVNINVTVTNTAPVINPIPDKTVNEGQLLTFDIFATDSDGNPLTYSATNLPAGASFDAGLHRFNWTPSYLQAGPYSVTFSVTDGIATTSVTVGITVNNVNTAPVITPIPNKNINTSQALTFDVFATDAEGDLLTYSATNLPSGAAFDAGLHRFNWTPSPSQAGTYNVTCSVSDGSLTSSVVVNIVVSVPNTAPVITAIPSKTVNEGQILTFDVVATDAESNPLTYSASNLPQGASFDATLHRFSWTPNYTQAGGPYAVTFSVSDGQLTSTVTVNITVVNVNTAPAITAVSNKTTNEGQLLTFDILATDAEGDALTYSAANLPTGATFDAGLHRFSWTPTYSQAGPYTVNFSVSDGNLSSSISVSITVNDFNTAPVVTAIPDKTVNEGQLLTFNIVATDNEGDALTYSFASLPQGASFDATLHRFSWTPTYAQSGSYTVNFLVTDGKLTSTVNAIIIVNNVNTAPVITAIGNKTINEGQLLTFDVVVTDAESDPLTYTVVGLPTGSSFDQTLHRFSWTPTYAQSGSYPLTILVSDGNLTATANVNITVVDINTAPVIGQIANKSVSINQLMTFDLAVTDAEGDPLTFTVTNKPTGATFDEALRKFSWTPTSAQIGVYDVGFSVSDGRVTSSITVKITVVFVNSAPVITAIEDKTVNEGQVITFDVVATDADNDPLIYGTGNLPTGATFNDLNRRFTWTPTFKQAGKYSITLFVNDGQATTTAKVNITVVDVNTAPVVTPISAKSAKTDETLTFTVSATDNEGDDLTYTATDLPQDATFDSQLHKFSWAPTASQVGSYQVSFTVSDGKLSSSITVDITIKLANTAPKIASIPDLSGKTGESISIEIMATDDEGDPLTYSATNLPQGAQFNAQTHKFTWTPGSNQAGNFSITFSVSDGKLSASIIVNINVIKVNRSPVFVKTFADTTIKVHNVQVEFKFQFLAMDPDGDPLTYSLNTGPDGGTMNSSGLFRWFPKADQAGKQFTILVTASDGLLAETAIANITTEKNIVGIEDQLSSLPSNYQVFQNYPNPFNPSTTIKFGLPKDGNVRLKIYNILGDEVVTLIDNYMSAGYHTVQFNATNLSSGMYFYKLESGNFVEMKKMLLMK